MTDIDKRIAILHATDIVERARKILDWLESPSASMAELCTEARALETRVGELVGECNRVHKGEPSDAAIDRRKPAG